MTAWALVVSSVLICIAFVCVASAKADLRSLAFRHTVKQPAQTVLILSGVIIATAAVTSAGVVGDSLRASVRRSAVTQLGPVDEEVLTSGIGSGPTVQSVVARSAVGRDVATLPLLSLSTTVVGRDFVARVAQAQILEVDFARAARFGGDVAATGISGSTPSGDHAVIGADLVASTAVMPGHRMSVEAYGVSRTFTIERVLPRLGVAGLAPVGQDFGSASLNLFVPPGTIESMLHEGRGAAGQARPVSVLAISNHRSNDPAESQRITARLRAVTAGLAVQVEPVKQLLLADADARSSRFTALFRAFGLFSVLGGLLLVVLTVLMLARDRARSMGILRANGFRRSRHVAALSLEGWLYSIVGAAIGGLAGLGIGALVMLVARDVFATQPAGRVNLVFSARPTSVAIGCAVGFLASLGVVVVVSVADSRRNIVRMIKGLANLPRAMDAALRRRIGAVFVAAGAATLVGGLVASNGVASVVGPAVAGAGLVPLVAAAARTRLAASVVVVAVFIWSSLVITVMRGAFRGLSVAVIATEGSVMVACAVALVSLNHAAITRRWTEPPGRRGLSFAIGVAYSRTSPKRTALIVSMYAVAIFTLALLLTVGQFYSHDVDALARRLGGAAAIEVTSDATRPVPARDVAQMPGVTHVSATPSINAQLQDGPTAAPIPVAVVGFDGSFIGHGSPPVVGGSGDALFRRVARDPTTVIVGTDLRADLPSGLPGTSLRVGDRVALHDPLTGATRTLTVAGLALETRWAGADHAYAARSVTDELGGGTAPANLLYVETAAGTNNDVVAAIIDGTHLPNGAYARSFRNLAADTLSAQRQFLDIGAGYATVGLLADLAGIGVLMIDRVRERRHQIAMMRALGLRGRTLGRAFRVEAAVIAAEGILVGLVTGVILAWRLGSSGGLGQRLAFSMPIGALSALAGAVVVASVAATSVPARRAARLRPAGALRSDE